MVIDLYVGIAVVVCYMGIWCYGGSCGCVLRAYGVVVVAVVA